MNDDPLRARRVRQEIGYVMREIRRRTPRVCVPRNKAKDSETWEGNLEGQPIRRLVIYLRSSGCTWALGTNKNGIGVLGAGCLDCEHSLTGTTFGEPIPAEAYVEQFETEWAKHETQECPVLCLYNEGSFYNPEELPPQARRGLLREIGAQRQIRSVVLESLPQYITEAVLDETIDLLGDRRIEIGIGLESANELVRDVCVNKPYTLPQFETAVNLIRRRGCVALAYVLLKPSFLTEAEALNDSLQTVEYAFHAGVNVVSIEPLSIGQHAMSGALSRLGMYRPAWLWSVLEVAKTSIAFGETRLGGYQFSPSYAEHAQNCNACTERVKEAITRFNATLDFNELAGEDCACKEEWKVELARAYPPLLDRIQAILPQLQAVYGMAPVLAA